jgi:hypothetical protein
MVSPHHPIIFGLEITKDGIGGSCCMRGICEECTKNFILKSGESTVRKT